MQQLSTESWLDRPWERTWSSCVRIAQRAWNMIWAEPWSLLSACPWWSMGSGSGLAVVDTVGMNTGWWVASQNHTSLVDSLWGGAHSGSFPVGVLWLYPLYTTAWRQNWGGQVLGVPCHRGSQSLRWQHTSLNSCSHNVLTPSTSLALGLGQTQQRKWHNILLLLGRTVDVCMGGS